MMRIGFTGTRLGLSPAQRETLARLFEQLQPSEFHHGDCVGADAEAAAIVRAHSMCRLICHPPEDTMFRAYVESHVYRARKRYLRRNHDIVDECELLVACSNWEVRLRSGTWATLRYARSIGRPARIVWPDGRVTKEGD